MCDRERGLPKIEPTVALKAIQLAIREITLRKNRYERKQTYKHVTTVACSSTGHTCPPSRAFGGPAYAGPIAPQPPARGARPGPDCARRRPAGGEFGPNWRGARRGRRRSLPPQPGYHFRWPAVLGRPSDRPALLHAGLLRRGRRCLPPK